MLPAKMQKQRMQCACRLETKRSAKAWINSSLARDSLCAGSLDRTGTNVNGQQLCGNGYGRPTEAMFEAVRLVAKTEGLN